MPKGAKEAAGRSESRTVMRKKIVVVASALIACLLVMLWTTTHSHTKHQSTIVDVPVRPATASALPVSYGNIAAPASVQGGAGATNYGTQPFSFPKIIHQTVANKSQLSCQQQQVINSWKRLNPHYHHRLWDDQEMRDFMLKHYPELVPVPYDEFLYPAERTDLWRVLVLNTLGGVYADMDVQCLQPIDDWNKDHAHDAAVLLGVENYDISRPEPIHIVNWVLASVPGHSLLTLLPKIVTRTVQQQYFEAAREEHVLTREVYEQGVIDRTGPGALTKTMYEYFHSMGSNLRGVAYESVTSAGGLIAGDVRLLPIDSFASGWDVAKSRSEGGNLTCEDMLQRYPSALVCHLYWGSWRLKWSFKQVQTYDNC